MTRRLLCLLTACLCLLPLSAQTNKTIRELESRRGALQRQISESEKLLQSTRKDVGSQLQGLATLTGQMEERRRYIIALNRDLETIDHELSALDRRTKALQRDLKEKREEYATSVRYLQTHSSIQDKLLFIFSAESLAQTYRRLRYVREFAAYQQRQGEEIIKRQKEVDRQRAELLQLREAKGKLLKERQQEMAKLQAQEKEKTALVDDLRRRQNDLQRELKKQRREAQQLNDRIDRLIAEEIEKARRRAEAEARRKAKEEAERRKRAEAQAKAAATATPAPTPSKAAPVETYTMDKADRQLSGSFASNRGKLPAPITGPYLIVSHYGRYVVMRGVQLDNKGIDLQGRPGAQAQAVFDGKVAAVFQLNGLFNVLVRHGAYISVYCNLSRATVKAGDAVKTRQPLGEVFSNPAEGGRTVLHFQLRKETQKLDPEGWIAR